MKKGFNQVSRTSAAIIPVGGGHDHLLFDPLSIFASAASSSAQEQPKPTQDNTSENNSNKFPEAFVIHEKSSENVQDSEEPFVTIAKLKRDDMESSLVIDTSNLSVEEKKLLAADGSKERSASIDAASSETVSTTDGLSSFNNSFISSTLLKREGSSTDINAPSAQYPSHHLAPPSVPSSSETLPSRPQRPPYPSKPAEQSSSAPAPAPAVTADTTTLTPTPTPISGDINIAALDQTFPFLTGEHKVMSIRNASIHIFPVGGVNGVLYMTNYRLAFIPPLNELRSLTSSNPALYSWLHIPLACIDKLEREKRTKDSNSMTIQLYCKDCRQLRINVKPFNPNSGDYELEKAFSVISNYCFPNNIRYLFAFTHILNRCRKSFDLYDEYARMGIFESGSAWRVSNANRTFELCKTYPEALVMPGGITDDELFTIAAFRSGQRLPALCWAHPNFVATLWRSSQPKAGVSGACSLDEKMLDYIAQSIKTSPKKSTNPNACLYIVDCRSKTSALANRAAGAGYESQNFYPTSRIDFYSIPNIHAVRDSLRSLHQIVLNPTANPSSDVTFSKQIEDTQWLTNVRLILKASWETANMLKKGIPVTPKLH